MRRTYRINIPFPPRLLSRSAAFRYGGYKIENAIAWVDVEYILDSYFVELLFAPITNPTPKYRKVIKKVDDVDKLFRSPQEPYWSVRLDGVVAGAHQALRRDASVALSGEARFEPPGREEVLAAAASRGSLRYTGPIYDAGGGYVAATTGMGPYELICNVEPLPDNVFYVTGERAPSVHATVAASPHGRGAVVSMGSGRYLTVDVSALAVVLEGVGTGVLAGARELRRVNRETGLFVEVKLSPGRPMYVYVMGVPPVPVTFLVPGASYVAWSTPTPEAREEFARILVEAAELTEAMSKKRNASPAGELHPSGIPV